LAILEQDHVSLEKILAKTAENFSKEFYLQQAFYAYYGFGDFEKARAVGREFVGLYPEADSNISLWLLNNR